MVRLKQSKWHIDKSLKPGDHYRHQLLHQFTLNPTYQLVFVGSPFYDQPQENEKQLAADIGRPKFLLRMILRNSCYEVRWAMADEGCGVVKM